MPAGPAPRPRWGCASAAAGAPPRVGPPRARPPPPRSAPPTPTTGARGPSPPRGRARRAPTVAPRRRFTDASPNSETLAAATAAPARPPARRFEMGSRVHVRRGVVSSVPDRGGQTPRAGGRDVAGPPAQARAALQWPQTFHVAGHRARDRRGRVGATRRGATATWAPRRRRHRPVRKRSHGQVHSVPAVTGGLVSIPLRGSIDPVRIN